MAYLQFNYSNGNMQQSSSLVAQPILFTKKPDDSCWPYLNCWVLNLAMVKNWYCLPHNSEILNSMHRGQIFTMQDLRNIYNDIQISGGDKFNTLCRIWYGQFKYWVMPFRLRYTESYIPSDYWQLPKVYMADFAQWHEDGILSYWTNKIKHEDHLYKVEEWPHHVSHCLKSGKHQFGASELDFLRFIISFDGIRSNSTA